MPGEIARRSGTDLGQGLHERDVLYGLAKLRRFFERGSAGSSHQLERRDDFLAFSDLAGRDDYGEPVIDQLRLPSDHAVPLSTSISRGRPSIRSAI